MIKEMDKVDGVKWALGLDSLVGPSVPSDIDSGVRIQYAEK